MDGNLVGVSGMSLLLPLKQNTVSFLELRISHLTVSSDDVELGRAGLFPGDETTRKESSLRIESHCETAIVRNISRRGSCTSQALLMLTSPPPHRRRTRVRPCNPPPIHPPHAHDLTSAFSWFESSSKYYVTFPLLTGGELLERLNTRGRFTEDAVRRVMRVMLVRFRQNPSQADLTNAFEDIGNTRLYPFKGDHTSGYQTRQLSLPSSRIRRR